MYYTEGDLVIQNDSFLGTGINEIYFSESDIYVDIDDIPIIDDYGCC